MLCKVYLGLQVQNKNGLASLHALFQFPIFLFQGVIFFLYPGLIIAIQIPRDGGTMENKNQDSQNQRDQEPQQVRGAALREKMIESQRLGEEFREHNPEDPTQKSQHGHQDRNPKIEIDSQ